MTGRTTPTLTPQHALRVLEGGLTTHQRLLDDADDFVSPARLAEEIAEAARLCDRLEADGLRVAFELSEGGPGVRVSVRDDHGHDVRQLDSRDATDVARLKRLSGIGG